MYLNKYNQLAWIRGAEKGNIEIGDNAWIGPFCVIDGEYDKVTIGKGLNLSSGAQIITHDTAKRCLTNKIYPHIDHAPITIGEHVYIGTNAVILKGCKIGDRCIIAAGTIIKEFTEIPSFSLVAGVPGTVKKNIESDYQSWINNENTI